MYRSQKSLPPLSQLPAFEASARLLSFTRAAQELHLSQAAISQQIKQLEDNLGVKLFERLPRRIVLTEEGQKFQHTVAVSLELLENAAVEIRSQHDSQGLTIAADISMAYLWLLPKFPLFRKKYPDMDVSILASDQESECLKPNVELALLYGSGHWEGFDSHLIIDEEVFPICSPDYLEAHPSLRFDHSLVNHVLLDLKAERWDWIDWHQFLSKNQVILNQRKRLLSFNSLPLLIQATLKGQGVGLGWKTLVDEHINSGELVRPFDISLKTNRGYYVIRQSNKNSSSEANLLYEWVLKTASLPSI